MSSLAAACRERISVLIETTVRWFRVRGFGLCRIRQGDQKRADGNAHTMTAIKRLHTSQSNALPSRRRVCEFLPPRCGWGVSWMPVTRGLARSGPAPLAIIGRTFGADGSRRDRL